MSAARLAKSAARNYHQPASTGARVRPPAGSGWNGARRDIALGGTSGAGRCDTRSSGPWRGAAWQETGPPRRSSASAVPCTRTGYPEGIFEAKDAIGLPIFFDCDGKRLYASTGQGRSATSTCA